MNEKMQKLIDRVNEGCYVKYDSRYVDGFLSIWEEEEGWFYSSEVWAKTPLEKLPIDHCRFFKELDLNGKEVE